MKATVLIGRDAWPEVVTQLNMLSARVTNLHLELDSEKSQIHVSGASVYLQSVGITTVLKNFPLENYQTIHKFLSPWETLLEYMVKNPNDLKNAMTGLMIFPKEIPKAISVIERPSVAITPAATALAKMYVQCLTLLKQNQPKTYLQLKEISIAYGVAEQANIKKLQEAIAAI